MASSRKKQDEKNLKTLRELGSSPQNKYCFDCNQRGPTYVNVTIGSFVCTKCSGMLRGITPPHRVKSISMATFTQDEIELLRSRGNDYCRKTWLGLHEGTTLPLTNDEQAIRDFMVDKYERRRYYLDPGAAPASNGVKPERPRQPPAVADHKPLARVNGVHNGTVTVPPPQNTHRTRPEVNRNNDFVADFDKADIFQMNNNAGNGAASFANFDNNPVFSNHSATNGTSTGLLTPAPLNGVQNGLNGTSTNGTNGWTQHQQTAPPPPVEDKYAALKDLDNALKSQSTLDWGSTGSNGSLYSSPTPTGSMYSSSSPQSSIFGSPSQSNFMSAFQAPQQENGTTNGVSNPFNANGTGAMNWSTTVVNGNGNGTNGMQPFANPFKVNGFAQGFQPLAAYPTMNPMPAVNGTGAWPPNPFKVGATGAMNSNNPFL
ncbi:arf-GAP domain and FG repeat-containing protein 1 [Aethina tumida]|uniref:arf-GAP domain and FG repeat-containing protein 1 n=1 Tax=Aethina tumida TaxID=116153 RepID=UPI0021490FC0|nr:arf-GAP domain and FG repeat-containing protein 1 [Aethina tumida]